MAIVTQDAQEKELLIQWGYLEEVRRQIEAEFSQSGQQLKELE